MIAAAPSWHTTIAICAVILPIAAGLLVQCVRDLGKTPPPLPLVISPGIAVAASTVLLFVSVAHRDYRLEGAEVAVLCAGSGVIVLLVCIDLIREHLSAVRRPH